MMETRKSQIRDNTYGSGIIYRAHLSFKHMINKQKIYYLLYSVALRALGLEYLFTCSNVSHLKIKTKMNIYEYHTYTMSSQEYQNRPLPITSTKYDNTHLSNDRFLSKWLQVDIRKRLSSICRALAFALNCMFLVALVLIEALYSFVCIFIVSRWRRLAKKESSKDKVLKIAFFHPYW